MNKTEQGVQRSGKYKYSLIQFFLSAILCFTQVVHAETNTAETPPASSDRTHQLFVSYTADSELQKNIVSTLSKSLSNKRDDIIITTVSPEENKNGNKKPDLIIAIGDDNIKRTNKLYPEINKLVISTNPDQFSPDNTQNNSNAVLYMTQPYCRQIKFTKLINSHWKNISILTNQNNPMAASGIKSCAKKYGMNTYAVETTITKYLTDEVKNALDHSDLLLALPNKDIFNEKTVKNILLTSYRHRKPVIAFSKNFVTSGALASIHSNITQISDTAVTLVEKYLLNDYRFTESVNYPDSYNISINRQVFKALNIKIPNTGKIKKSLELAESDNKNEVKE